MVFFTCNGCGASLKKNQVEKHQQFQCRKSHHLSCIDCCKDFLGDEYKAHVKCISEAEKYSGKDYVAKPGQNKNERKQTEWVAMVQELVSTVGNTDSALTQVLQKISQHENIPRKKPKFMNFLKNIMGNRVNPSLAEQAWGLISKALEEQRANKEKNASAKTNQDNAVESKSSEANGFKRKKDEENDHPADAGIKKIKKDSSLPIGGALNAKEDNNCSNDTSDDATVSTGKLKWCTIAKTILRAQDDKELPLKKFQKKIVAEYIRRAGDTINDDPSVEVLWAKGLKKLSKNPKFKIHKERIKLVS